ncbi:hypothetical protein RCO48_20590 [Peribacillus frigoritolerans]|nr:hypothetical protein [Peribacillus frigoritolerans]
MKKEIGVILEEMNGVFHKMDEGVTDALLKKIYGPAPGSSSWVKADRASWPKPLR